LFLRIAAVTLLVVAVRVAVTAAMTTGLGSGDAAPALRQAPPDAAGRPALAELAPRLAR
jgi:hypothetical protein